MAEFSLDQIDAELARRGDAPQQSGGAAGGFSLGDIDGELKARGVDIPDANANPGGIGVRFGEDNRPSISNYQPTAAEFAADDAAIAARNGQGQQAPAAPQPTVFGRLLNNLTDTLLGGAQHTYPIATPDKYTLAPQEHQDVFNETGLPKDAQATVVLRNPATGQLAVYWRNPEMAEGAPQAVGRFLAQGTLSPVTRAPSLVAETLSPAASLLKDYQTLGVAPRSAAALSGNRGTQILENTLSNIPGGAQAMQGAREATLADTSQAATGLANQFGPVKTPQGAGETIREGVVNAGKRFDVRQADLYDKAYNLVGADTPVPVNNVKALLGDLTAQVAKAPESLGAVLGPAISRTQKVIADAEASGGAVPFQALRQIRTAIREDLNNPVLMGSTGGQNTALERLYGALTQDLAAGAASAGPEAKKAIDVANRYTRFNMTQNAPILERIKNLGTDEAAYKFALSAAQDGGSRLRALLRNLTPEERGTVAGTTLGRLGLAKPGAQGATLTEEAGSTFSPSTFLTRWNQLSPEAKDALFGGTKYAELRPKLDALVRVVNSQKNVEKLQNTSHTAGQLAFGGAIAAITSGEIFMMLGSAGASFAAAKFMTNPAVVKWLTTAPMYQTPTQVASHAARLDAIIRTNPDLGPSLEALKRAYTQPHSAPASEDRESRSGGR